MMPLRTIVLAMVAILHSHLAAAELQWKPLSHKDAQLTIISDHFRPIDFSQAKSLDAEYEQVVLAAGGGVAGILLFDQFSGVGHFCGYSESVVKDALSSGGWMEGILTEFGSPNFRYGQSKPRRTTPTKGR